MFEIPFISLQRRDYIGPFLTDRDLWKIYDLSWEWTTLEIRRRLIVRMITEINSRPSQDTRLSIDDDLYLRTHLKSAENIVTLSLYGLKIWSC